MRRVVHFAIVAVLATEALMLAQNGDASRCSGCAHALGADKFQSVRALSAIGRRRARVPTERRRISSRCPSSFPTSIKRDVVRRWARDHLQFGFNGDGLINETDVPPALSSGGNVPS